MVYACNPFHCWWHDIVNSLPCLPPPSLHSALLSFKSFADCRRRRGRCRIIRTKFNCHRISRAHVNTSLAQCMYREPQFTVHLIQLFIAMHTGTHIASCCVDDILMQANNKIKLNKKKTPQNKHSNPKLDKNVWVLFFFSSLCLLLYFLSGLFWPFLLRFMCDVSLLNALTRFVSNPMKLRIGIDIAHPTHLYIYAQRIPFSRS